MYKSVLAAAAQQFPDSGEFFGTIDGHDLIAPIKVMGILFVERAFAGEHGESRVHGCYTTEKRENAYWDTYHMLAGTLDSDGELVIHSFSDEGHQLSELTGSVTDLSSTVRLMGKNSQGNTRIWRIRVARHDAVHAVMLEHEQHLDVAEREEHAFTVSADALRAKIAAFAAGGADVAAASATTVTTEAAAREGSAWEEAVNKATAALPAEADEVTLETLELDAGVGAEWSVDAAAATASGADPTAVSAAEVDAQAQLERARAVREKELGLAIAALSKMERSVVTERRATHVEALAARRATANVNKTAALAAVEAELAQVVAESSTKTAAAEADVATSAAEQKELERKVKDLGRKYKAAIKAAAAADVDVTCKLEEAVILRRQMRMVHNKVVELKGNIRVLCRCRPRLPFEEERPDSEIACTFPRGGGAITVEDRSERRTTMEFDEAYPPGSTQAEVFEGVKSVACSVMDGYNVCIFAYGQTGSGKTFTMEGDASSPGVNHNVVGELFRLQGEHAAHTMYEFKVSMMEVYNEEVYDLFDVHRQKLNVRYTKERGGYAENLTERPVACVEDVMEALREGATHRSTGHTNMNAHSSRSHLILTVHCQGHELIEGGKVYDARLNLVDLAGSERVNKSAVKGAALLEAQAINKSLSSLGDVIQALGEKKKKGGHVPFRNSKLTYILEKSLSQGSKVLMVANCSPVLANASETLCTLKFAHRCRNVSLGKAHSSKHHGAHPDVASSKHHHK